jgi:hypothetical protein
MQGTFSIPWLNQRLKQEREKLVDLTRTREAAYQKLNKLIAVENNKAMCIRHLENAIKTLESL